MGACASKAMTTANVRRVSDIAFDKYDKDQSGAIGASQVKEALASCIGKFSAFVPTQLLMNQVDEDGSGDLNKDEFYHLVIAILKKANVEIHESDPW